MATASPTATPPPIGAPHRAFSTPAGAQHDGGSEHHSRRNIQGGGGQAHTAASKSSPSAGPVQSASLHFEMAPSPQTPSLFPIAIVSSRPTDTKWPEPGSTLSWSPPFFVLQILGNFLQLFGLLAGELVITIIRRKKKKYYCRH